MDPADPNEALVRQIAKLYYGEDRSSPSLEEARRIAGTVLERSGRMGWPDDPLDVIAQPKQYSPFNPTDPNYPIVTTFGESHPDWAKFYGLAQQAIANPVRGFTHYFAGKPPAWASSMLNLTKVGEHTYGLEPRKKKSPARR